MSVSLYNSLFAYFLQCGIVVLGLTYDSCIKLIFILQKEAVRAVAFENRYAPSSPIFHTLQLLKLEDLFELKLLTFVFFPMFINMIPGRPVKVTFL